MLYMFMLKFCHRQLKTLQFLISNYDSVVYYWLYKIIVNKEIVNNNILSEIVLLFLLNLTEASGGKLFELSVLNFNSSTMSHIELFSIFRY